MTHFLFDVNRCRKAMKDLIIRGVPDTPQRLRLIEDAIRQIQHDPVKALAGEYLGIKNYAGFGDQREDHRYGMGPRHGTIVFSVERRRPGESTSLGADHIYLLECVRDAGSVLEFTDPRNTKQKYNLCAAINKYDDLRASVRAYEEALSKVSVESALEQCA